MSFSKSMVKKRGLTALLVLFAFLFTGLASAGTVNLGNPTGWTGVGNYGSGSANGDVTPAPSGGTQYGWVSTRGGVACLGLNLGSETDGSIVNSPVFSARAGDSLNFNFNYITSDGAGFTDYAWSSLFDSSRNTAAVLFTARTSPDGNSVPGFGLPPVTATITPSSGKIFDGAPVWSQLGESSGQSYDVGSGYTGWIGSSFVIPSDGIFYLQFGVVNWLDEAFDSGLAFDGITVAGTPIGPPPNPVPEPGTMMLLGSGLIGLAGYGRKPFFG